MRYIRRARPNGSCVRGSNSNLIQIVDDRGGTTTYEYDEQDRLITTIQHDGSRKTNLYNLASDIVQTTDENGSVLNNIYDVLGRKITVNITRASGVQGTTQQSYQYDGLSRPTWHRDSSFESWLYHDSLNRVVEENQNSRYATNNAFTSLTESEFTYPNARKVTTSHDALYRKDEIKESSDSSRIAKWHYIGDRTAEVLLGNGIVQTMLNNSRTHSMVQTDVPNPNWGTANSDRLGFDGSSRLIAKRYLAGGINSTSHAYNDTLPVVGFTTQYDLSGNKMYERELHAETRSSLYQPFDEKGYAQGGYDSADRLRKALRGVLSDDGGYTATGGGNITTPIALPNTDTSRTYDLDGLGNWKQSDYIPVGGAATIDLRQHNKLNEITSRKVGDDAKVLFAYDGTSGASNGNLTDDGTLELSYDAFNRLIQVKRKSDGATIGQYVYDALNRRVSKAISNGGLTGGVPNGSTTFLYQNWQVVEELGGSASTTKQYVWGQYIDECIQLKTLTATGPQSLPAGDYYPLQDLLYRTTALTDDEGNIAEAYDYDAYGNTLIFSAAGTGDNWWADDATQANYAACEVLYDGYRYDPESKLYQVRNREYIPTLGRWLQRDPIGFDGEDWNLYGYVISAPINWTDADGLQPYPGDAEYDPYYDPYRGGPPPTRSWPSTQHTPEIPASAMQLDVIRFLTGKGPRSVRYGPKDQIFKDFIIGNPDVEDFENSAINQISHLNPTCRLEAHQEFTYEPGFEQFLKDAFILPHPLNPNWTTSAVGGWTGNWRVIDVAPNGKWVTINFYIRNPISITSLTRNPITRADGLPNKSSGIGGTVHQHFYWSKQVLIK